MWNTYLHYGLIPTPGAGTGKATFPAHSCRRSATFENPWVSVQDVVLNSLEPSTLPSQPLPELSHFYTSTKKAKYLAHVAMVLVVVSRLDTKVMRSRQLTCFCQLHKSDHKNTCPYKKSLHQDMVCLFK